MGSELFSRGAGAGRIDLYVKLVGGLSIVVEPKMCAFGYSRPYAASGKDQIIHYMGNRQTLLDYLVVFDSQVDKCGAPLLSGNSGPHTVIEIFIDVRPRATQRNA